MLVGRSYDVILRRFKERASQGESVALMTDGRFWRATHSLMIAHVVH